jgi:phosphatidylglycerophosphatase A
MRRLILFLATGFGVGWIPGMPGTYGSLVGIGLFWCVMRLPAPIFLITLVTIMFIGVWVSTQAEIFLGQVDAQVIVIDEVVGVMLALMFIPYRWETAAAGFFLFRLFDIWKPFPICKLQDLPAGWGVMMDDVGAGLLANLVLQIAIRLI